MSAARALVTCAVCGSSFEARGPRARYCSEPCRYEAKKRQYAASAEQQARQRERERRHWQRRRDQDLDAEAPEYGPYLPGGACLLSTRPEWRLEHRHLSALHGLLSSLTGPHDPTVPRFVLAPSDCPLGWAVVLCEDDLRGFAGRTHMGRLSTSRVELVAGPLMRLKTPPRPEPGRYRVELETLTPLVLRSGQPTGGALHSSMVAWLPRRIGLQAHRIAVRAVDRRVWLEGRGWTGQMLLETNAPGLWWLRVAERIGLGGRCAYGYGRVRIAAAERA